MSDLREKNKIFIMYLATESFKKVHNYTSQNFLDLNQKYKILDYISECPDIFDSMTEEEMAKEIDYYVTA